MAISRAQLFGKLNTPLYKALEKATVACKMQGNPYVELVHWLVQILEIRDGDLERIVRVFRLDPERVAAEIATAIKALPTGYTSINDISEHVEHATERAWSYVSLMYNAQAIRSAHLLYAILQSTTLRKALEQASPSLAKIDPERLLDRMDEVTKGSAEAPTPPDRPSPHELFICYRREDARHFCGRIFDTLARELGAEHVFRDVHSIPIGSADFAAELESRLSEARAVIALIGPSWLSLLSTENDPKSTEPDFVQAEIAWALQCGVPLIPVLFDGASMPRAAQLPSSISKLSRCQAVEIRDDPHFALDVARLLNACRAYVAQDPNGS